MNEFEQIPTVFILRQAMDVIRRESLKFDIETGGILIGSRSNDGAILVTHATPPGPEALHNEVFFKRDVVFQQAALNKIYRRYGVQYLGEWHKHPRNLPVPSGGDFQGVRELLDDPDYGVNDLLFPIIICESDLGFQINPFYVSKKNIRVGFIPMVWREITLAMDLDHTFERASSFDKAAEISATSNDSSEEKPDKITHDRKQSWFFSWRNIERQLPFFRRSPDRSEMEFKQQRKEDEKAIHDNMQPTYIQWYETNEGQKRLSREQRLLKSFGLSSQPFTTNNNQLCFSFPRGCGREIVAICAFDHPKTPPNLMIRKAAGDTHSPLDIQAWNADSNYLADLIVPMLGPSIEV